MFNARSWSVTGVLAAAVLATAASSANAAFTYNVAADNGTRSITYFGPFTPAPTALGPMYTAYGSPVVTNNGNVITFNFNAGLSPNFSAQADGALILQESTDGHLVLNLHFDTPVSLTANITEGGVYSKSANSSVSASGGEFVIEAVGNSESHASNLTANFDSFGGWTATASTVPFNGVFTDYQVIIDNDLLANATINNPANIFKKSFILQITTNGSGSGVPEPASLGVLGLGMLGLVARRRR